MELLATLIAPLYFDIFCAVLLDKELLTEELTGSASG
jgi:hypothetical protein